LVLVAGLGLAACGGDDDDSASGSGSGSGSGSASAVAPEDLRTSDAAVAAGLAQISATAARVATAVETGDDTASDLDETIEPKWQAIEGTIKENDADSYITFEDNFAVLSKAVKDEDGAQAKDAAQVIASTAEKYLAEHPG